MISNLIRSIVAFIVVHKVLHIDTVYAPGTAFVMVIAVNSSLFVFGRKQDFRTVQRNTKRYSKDRTEKNGNFFGVQDQYFADCKKMRNFTTRALHGTSCIFEPNIATRRPVDCGGKGSCVACAKCSPLRITDFEPGRDAAVLFLTCFLLFSFSERSSGGFSMFGAVTARVRVFTPRSSVCCVFDFMIFDFRSPRCRSYRRIAANICFAAFHRITVFCV